MSFNFNKLYIDGLWTQWAFHRVQEHPQRSSLLSFMLILIFIQFTCSLFIYVFTIHLRIYYLYSLFTIYIRIHSLFTISFTIHYSLFTFDIRSNLHIYYSFTIYIRIHLRIYYSFRWKYSEIP